MQQAHACLILQHIDMQTAQTTPRTHSCSIPPPPPPVSTHTKRVTPEWRNLNGQGWNREGRDKRQMREAEEERRAGGKRRWGGEKEGVFRGGGVSGEKQLKTVRTDAGESTVRAERAERRSREPDPSKQRYCETFWTLKGDFFFFPPCCWVFMAFQTNFPVIYGEPGNKKSVSLFRLWVPTELVWPGARTKRECSWGHLRFECMILSF